MTAFQQKKWEDYVSADLAWSNAMVASGYACRAWDSAHTSVTYAESDYRKALRENAAQEVIDKLAAAWGEAEVVEYQAKVAKEAYQEAVTLTHDKWGSAKVAWEMALTGVENE